jgi:O-antigen/teichoic acid export membrane protein
MHKLIKNTTIYALGDICPKLLSFITFPILTRYLAPDDYAIVSYIGAVNVFLVAFTYLCLNTYYLVFYFRVGGEIKQKELFGNITIFVSAVNILLTVVALIFGKSIFSAIGSKIDFYPYLAIGIITNFVGIFNILPAALFRVQERPLPLTIVNIVRGLLTMGVTLTLVVCFGYKALGVLYASLAMSVLFGIFFIIVTLKNMIWNINLVQLKEALIFSLPLLPGSLAHYAVSVSDRIFIEKYLNLFDLGIYSTASSIAIMLNLIAYSSYKAFEPYFFKIYGTEKFTCNFVKVHNAFLAIILLGAMLLGIFAKEFYHFLAGSQYQTAYYYVPMILIGIVCSAISMLFGTILTAQKKTKISSVVVITGGITSCVLNITLLPVMGLPAACLSSGISFGLMLLMYIYFVKIKMDYWTPVKGLLLSAVAVWLLVYVFSFGNIWLSIVIKSFVIMLVMACIILLFKFDLRNLKLNFAIK